MTAITCSIVVAAGVVLAAAQQTAPQPPRFRVAVDAVSIDAVVTDRKGQVVRDLTAADFEILQDGKPQRVVFAEFVPVAAALPPTPAVAAGTRTAPAPTAPPPPLTRDQVSRTIVIVVDDLGLSFEGINNVRRGLRQFVANGLLPSDLVGIVRTGEARGLLHPLTNDREVMRAAVDTLRYSTSSRKLVAPSGDVFQGLHGPEIEEVGEVVKARANEGSLAALNLVVQAARDLPGRKTVIFASEGFDLNDPVVRGGLDHAVDQATRSGVVIYAIDGQGLQTGALRASDDLHKTAEMRDPWASGAAGGGDSMSPITRGLGGQRRGAVLAAQESLQYMSEPTGGFAVVNTNDLGAGLLRISDDVRDYYVIGYVPDRATFAGEGPPGLHKITVKVKRAGAQVRTRKEFLGISDPERTAVPLTPAQQLVLAAMSPFSAAAIPLHATHLTGYAPGRGLYVRSMLHVDAQAFTFSTDADGTRTATVDLVGLVYDSGGVQVDVISAGFDVTLESAAAEKAFAHGLDYTALTRLKTAGGYQIRYAVRDRRSGAIGSIGGFVNVPDVAAGAFAISGIVLRAGQRPDIGEPLDTDRLSVRPSDASADFTAGGELGYGYEIYNAGPAVQTVVSVWRDGNRIVALPPSTAATQGDGRGVPVTGTVALPADLSAGVYVLQIATTSDDPKQPKRSRAAVQQVAFEVK